MAKSIVETDKFCKGTAAINLSNGKYWWHRQGDYWIDLEANSYPKETRAYRESAKRRGKKRSVRSDSLKNEAVVIFGPEVTPNEAIELLRNLANQIVSRGMFTGADETGRWMTERKIRQI